MLQRRQLSHAGPCVRVQKDVQHAELGGKRPVQNCEAAEHARLNLAMCSFQLCGGLMQLEGLSEEGAVGQKLNGWEGAGHMKVWGKSTPGRGKERKAKGLRWEEEPESECE